uniref:Uncharacterized protein n=1 Tax=Arundo donax TaxID=35708 RepID=A0A0A8YZI4_ARUDO
MHRPLSITGSWGVPPGLCSWIIGWSSEISEQASILSGGGRKTPRGAGCRRQRRHLPYGIECFEFEPSFATPPGTGGPKTPDHACTQAN